MLPLSIEVQSILRGANHRRNILALANAAPLSGVASRGLGMLVRDSCAVAIVQDSFRLEERQDEP